MERQLIADYERDVMRLLASLTPEKHEIAVSIAAIPDAIKGFGHIKQKNIIAAKAESARLWQRFNAPQPAQHVA